MFSHKDLISFYLGSHGLTYHRCSNPDIGQGTGKGEEDRRQTQEFWPSEIFLSWMLIDHTFHKLWEDNPKLKHKKDISKL